MRRNKARFYKDYPIPHPDWTLEDFEREEERLKKECEELTEWPEIE